MVTIQVGGEATHATTGQAGRFRVTIPVAPGSQAIDLAFRGGKLMEGSQLCEITDPSRAQVVLTIDVEDVAGGLRCALHTITANNHRCS